ncbi:MAG: hypothetical protein R6V53_04175, partial [Candidatus Woesearchaeota archaeon]
HKDTLAHERGVFRIIPASTSASFLKRGDIPIRDNPLSPYIGTSAFVIMMHFFEELYCSKKKKKN